MDSTKLIIGILIVVFFVIKTIIGDAKKEKEKKTPSSDQKKPKTVFPQFFFEDEPQKEKEPEVVDIENIPFENIITTPSNNQNIIQNNGLNDEQLQAHSERWKQAIIDSEILKTKF